MRQIRVSRGLSQSELAAEIGVTPQVISTYESGRKIPPKLDRLEQIAHVLHVDVGDFFAKSDEPFPPSSELRQISALIEKARSRDPNLPAKIVKIVKEILD